MEEEPEIEEWLSAYEVEPEVREFFAGEEEIQYRPALNDQQIHSPLLSDYIPMTVPLPESCRVDGKDAGKQPLPPATEAELKIFYRPPPKKKKRKRQSRKQDFYKTAQQHGRWEWPRIKHLDPSRPSNQPLHPEFYEAQRGHHDQWENYRPRHYSSRHVWQEVPQNLDRQGFVGYMRDLPREKMGRIYARLEVLGYRKVRVGLWIAPETMPSTRVCLMEFRENMSDRSKVWILIYKVRHSQNAV